MRRSVRSGGTRRKHATKRKPTTHRRRRRIGAAGNMGGLINIVGGLGVGGIAGRELAILGGKLLPSVFNNQMLDGAIQTIVGYFLPKFVKGQFMQFVGYGMIASGVQTIAVGTGIINGPGSVMAYRIGGTSNLKVVGRVNGTSNLRVVGGVGDNRIQNPPSVGGPVRARNFQNFG